MTHNRTKVGRLRGALRVLGLTALGCLLLLLTLWAAAALYFDVRVSWLRTPLAAAYVLAVLAVWILVKGRWLEAGPDRRRLRARARVVVHAPALE